MVLHSFITRLPRKNDKKKFGTFSKPHLLSLAEGNIFSEGTVGKEVYDKGAVIASNMLA